MVAAREVSARDLTVRALSHALQSSAQTSPHGLFPHVSRNCTFTEVWERDALEVADRIDAQAWREDDHPPLLGVPIAIKDMFAIAGRRRGNGARTPGDMDDTDSDAVVRLRAAGAVLVGATNMHEYAYGGTSVNLHTGTVRNAWDEERVAMGSSGGSAVAVATSVVPLALGTDTGGSVRGPASANGVIGLKPTWGSVSTAGVTPLSWSLDHVGVLATLAADALAAWRVLAGVQSSNAPEARSDRPLRIGLVYSNGASVIDPVIRGLLERAAEALRSEGHQVTSTEVPEMAAAVTARDLIAAAEAYALHRVRLESDPGHYGIDVRQRLEFGRDIPAHVYVDALRSRHGLRRAICAAVRGDDMLLMPTLSTLPPTVVDALKEQESPAMLHAAFRIFTGPFNLLGWPAVSVPIGWHEGVPVGAQLVARPGGETALMRLAEDLDGACGYVGRPFGGVPLSREPDPSSCGGHD